MKTNVNTDAWTLAIEFICFTSQSVFLSGKAGTGKTTFLQQIRTQALKKMIVLAPTGIAAINANGITIHSFFQLPFSVLDAAYFNKPVPSFNKDKISVVRELELLIIDEISMVRADIMDGIDRALRFYRNKPNQTFGGVQLLLIGDLLQLSPVLSGTDVSKMDALYPSPFFFEANALKQLDLARIELTQVYRQSDDRFISVLNSIRTNSCTDEELAWLNEWYLPDEKMPNDYMLLTTHKSTAEMLNKKALQELDKPLIVTDAVVTGNFDENSDPAPRRLEIKEGAKIIFTKNDSGADRAYYNGKRGTILHVHEDRLSILTDDDQTVEVERATWINRGTKYDNASGQIQDTELGSFRQFPIKLGWAITIHKSQGMTFEKAIIDASNSFAPGQVYVALSRLKSIDGLILRAPITKEVIAADPRIISYLNNTTNTQDPQSGLLAGKEKFRHALLSELFSFEKLRLHLGQLIKEHTEISFPPDPIEAVKELSELSVKFCNKLNNLLLTADSGDYAEVLQVTKKGADYFEKAIADQLIHPLQKFAATIKQTKKNELLIEALSALFELFVIKKKEQQTALLVAEGLAESLNTSELIHLIINQRNRNDPEMVLKMHERNEVVKNVSTQLKTLLLFNRGLTVEEIALKRKLNAAIIEDHLCSFIRTGQVALNQLVEDNKVTSITEVHNQNPGFSVHEIRYALGTTFSFGEIRAVLETL